jgi:XTP/dITP diphosphohydrolase
MKIVFASSNAGKIRELQILLNPLKIEIIPQNNLGVKEIAETGSSFVENALLKAKHASRITGLPAIADDSGLEVTALNNAPGIYSARFAGKNATSEDNIKKLLHDLQNVPDNKRQARFYCCLIYLANADATPIICEGIWDGFILKQPTGNDGFGYDPIFFDPNEQCSAAQLSIDKKNLLSHRGKALKCLIEKLPGKL